MYWNVRISQRSIVEHFPTLKFQHGAILDWFNEVHGAPGMQSIADDEGNIYTWIKYSYVREELPLLQIKTDDRIYRILRQLCEVGLLKAHPQNSTLQKSFYAKGPKWNLLQRGGSPPQYEEQSSPVPPVKKPAHPRSKNRADTNTRDTEDLKGKFEELPLEMETVNDPDERKLIERLQKKGALKWKDSLMVIVDYFREVTGRERVRYSTKDTIRYIVHWLEEGMTVEQIKLVIDFKTDYFRRRGNQENMNVETYLRFEKFESNLQNAEAWKERSQKREAELFDADLPQKALELYRGHLKFVESQCPNLWDAGKVLKASEFAQIFGAKFLPRWRNYYPSYGAFSKDLINELRAIEGKPWEIRKKEFQLSSALKKAIKAKTEKLAA